MSETQPWKGAIEVADPQARQNELLGRLREHASDLVAASSGMGRRFADAGVAPADLTSMEALRAIEPITKSEIIADQAAHPPYGTLNGADPDELVRLYVGPGPQVTYFTEADLRATVGHGSWAFHTNGFRPADVVDVTIMYHWVIAGTMMDDAYRNIGCAVLPGGIGMGAEHLANLKLLKATGMFAFPTFLEELASKAQESGIEPTKDLPNLRLVTIAGEMRSPLLQKRMEEFWGVKVREIYGGAEMPFIGAQCDAGAGMHLNPEFIVEVVNAETKEPVGPGEPGVIIATELERRAYPMLRYWTGDITEGLDVSPCDCGRTTPRMGRILGRVGDIARIKGLFVVPNQVQRALDPVPGLGRFQIVVDRPGRQDVLTLRVEHEGESADRPALAEQVARAVKEGIRLTAQIELLDVGALGEAAPLTLDLRDVSS
ncbi:MAG: phenylacetate--CoA ligase family protein [Nostocoides sp.]